MACHLLPDWLLLLSCCFLGLATSDLIGLCSKEWKGEKRKKEGSIVGVSKLVLGKKTQQKTHFIKTQKTQETNLTKKKKKTSMQ